MKRGLKTRRLPDPSNVSLTEGINVTALGYLVSDPIHYFLLSIFSLSLSRSLSPLFLTSVRNFYRLWGIGIESAFAFILLGF